MTKKEVVITFKQTLDNLNSVKVSNQLKAEALYQALVDLLNKEELANVNSN